MTKTTPFCPPKRGAPASRAGEGWGAYLGATMPPNMEDMGVKNTSRARFPLKLRMLGVAPGSSRGCFGELGLSLDCLMAGTGLSQNISCERRTERDYFLVFFLFSRWGRRGGGSLRKKKCISSGNGVKAGIPGIWCCGAMGASWSPPPLCEQGSVP